MSTVIRTTLATILPTLRVRLVDVTGLPIERVGLVQREDVPFHGHGDSYLFVRVEDGGYDMPNIIGAGRLDAREEIVFSVTVRSRLSLDEANQDFLWLTDESLGNAVLRHSVLDAMLLFQPMDADDNWLITEPIKPAKSRRPRKAPDKVPNKEWGESVLFFSFVYELDLNLDYM